jgi:hypothetical protein
MYILNIRSSIFCDVFHLISLPLDLYFSGSRHDKTAWKVEFRRRLPSRGSMSRGKIA